MKFSFAATLAATLFAIGCATPLPPGAERGPHNTMAYDVLIEASAPGVQILANGERIGEAPVHLKIFGDPDGTFHDFGSSYYEVRALPSATNQFEQVRHFGTGQMFGPEDRIPQRIYFDMSQPPPKVLHYPVYVTPPPVYYDSFYYPGPYYGPSFRFHFGGSHYRHGGHYHRH